MLAATATASADDPALQAARHATFTRHALRNVRVISYSYLVDGAVLLMYALAGCADWQAALAYTALGLGVGAAWTAVFSRGLTLRLRDPHMPMTLSFSHQALQLLGMVLMPQLAFMFLLILFIVFTSVAMRVRLSQAATACGVSCVGAGLVLWLTGTTVRVPDAALPERLLSWGVIVLTLWQCTWIGTYNGAMSALLKRRGRELAELTRRVEHLAHHDELTGLLNRRSLLAKLTEAQHRTDRTGAPLTVALLDIDHFKRINDTLGHPAGDRALKHFSTTVLQLSRATDHFGRYGGEEFLVVLNGTTPDEARIPIDRFRQALHAGGWEDVAPGLDVTFSCGLAAYRPGDTTEELVRRADEALYTAKREGRDRTRVA